MILVATGQSYERTKIEKWFLDGNRTCPSTGLQLQSTLFIKNFNLRKSIQDWLSSFAPSAARLRSYDEVTWIVSLHFFGDVGRVHSVAGSFYVFGSSISSSVFYSIGSCPPTGNTSARQEGIRRQTDDL